MRRIRYGIALVAATAFLISGCAGDSNESTSSAVGGAPAVPPEAATAGGTGQDAAGGSSAAPGAPRGEPADDAKVEPSNRSVIQKAELSVQAKDVMGAADKARQIVSAAGGYAFDEKSSSQSGSDIAVITFKVPPDRYADVLAQLGRDLGKRYSQRQGTEDVTGEVADVASRVKSAESSLAQFRLLLSKATKIGEILEIEREISSRESDLESLQARQRALSAQTAMATITLTVTPPPTPAPVAKVAEPEGPSFLSGLKTGWKTLVASTGVALALVGALLPWLVVAGVVWLAVIAVMRRVRPRRTPPGPGAGTPARGPGGEPPVPAMAGGPSGPPAGAVSGTPAGPPHGGQPGGQPGGPHGTPPGPPHGGQPGGPYGGPPQER
jgi:hypothetical protein